MPLYIFQSGEFAVGCVANTIIDVLRKAGCQSVFAIPGSLTHMLAYFSQQNDFYIYTSTHEESLGYMALGYYAIARVPPVILVTQGPGVTNLVTSIACAWRDRVPMVILTGYTEDNGTVDFQDSSGRYHSPDVRAILRPITEAQIRLDTTDLKKSLADLQEGLWNLTAPILVEIASPEIPLQKNSPLQSGKNCPTTIDLAGAFNTMNARAGDVFLLGEGARFAPVDRIVGYAQEHGANIATTLRAIDLVKSNTVGLIGHVGYLGKHSGNEFLAKYCKRVIGIGTSLNRMTLARWFEPFRARGGNVIRVADDEDFPCWIKPKDRYRVDLRSVSMPFIMTKKVSAKQISSPILRHIQNYPGPKTFVFESFPQTFFEEAFVQENDRVLSTASHAPIGCGVSLAMGAALVSPSRPHFVFVGDGGFILGGMVLLTARRYTLPIFVAVLVNGEYGRVANAQRRRFGRTFCTDLVLPDFDTLGKTFGVKCEQCTDEEKFFQVVDNFMVKQEPTVAVFPALLLS